LNHLVNDSMTIDDRTMFIKKKINEVNQKIKALMAIKGFLQEHIDNDCAYNSDSMIAKLKSKDSSLT